MWSTATNDLTQYFAVRKRFFNSGYIANQEFLAEAAKQYVSECDANLICTQNETITEAKARISPAKVQMMSKIHKRIEGVAGGAGEPALQELYHSGWDGQLSTSFSITEFLNLSDKNLLEVMRICTRRAETEKLRPLSRSVFLDLLRTIDSFDKVT